MKAPHGAWGLGVQGLGFRALRGLGAPTRGALMGLGLMAFFWLALRTFTFGFL